jgi:uncharacterized protein (TIGR03437 family)
MLVWSYTGLNMATAVPGVFTLAGTGSGQAGVENADRTSNGATNAASRGSCVSVYVTGFGVFSDKSADGFPAYVRRSARARRRQRTPLSRNSTIMNSANAARTRIKETAR